MNIRLLIIEDDSRMREIINDYFTSKQFIVSEAIDGADALLKLEKNEYDIAFLDIMMPNIDGFTVCRSIRAKSNMPVIFLTARSREDDILFGYELGADDYVTKPFSLPVLHAKVLTLLNRAKVTASNGCYIFDWLVINTKSRTVSIENESIILAPKEYELLLYLVENRGIVLTREQILNAVWGWDYYGDERAVDTHIKKLRKAMNNKADCIKTVIKGGYRFESE